MPIPMSPVSLMQLRDASRGRTAARRARAHPLSERARKRAMKASESKTGGMRESRADEADLAVPQAWDSRRGAAPPPQGSGVGQRQLRDVRQQPSTRERGEKGVGQATVVV